MISGRFTPWKLVEGFPYPVRELLALEPYGNEFWVKADDDQIYVMQYPCEDDVCWKNTSDVPKFPLNEFEPVFIQKTDGKCLSNFFIRKPRKEIKTCITANTLSPDGTPWKTALALSEKGKLWIWIQPWDSPYNTFPQMVFATIVGGVLGLFVALNINIRKPSEGV